MTIKIYIYTGSPGGKPPRKTSWDKNMEETGPDLCKDKKEKKKEREDQSTMVKDK
jgi:hypothetical protein